MYRNKSKPESPVGFLRLGKLYSKNIEIVSIESPDASKTACGLYFFNNNHPVITVKIIAIIGPIQYC
jgi:hypothetical protein